MEKERYEAIKEMTETRNTGVANAYLKGNDGRYTKFYFEDTPENIANLIEEFKEELAEKYDIELIEKTDERGR